MLKLPPRPLKSVTTKNGNFPKESRKHEVSPPRVKEGSRLDSNDFGFICTGISNVGGYKETP